jgi:hypothetical protein
MSVASDLKTLGESELIRLGGLTRTCSVKLTCAAHGHHVPCELCEVEGVTQSFCSACGASFVELPVQIEGRACHSIRQFNKDGKIAFESEAQAALDLEGSKHAEEIEEKRLRERKEAREREARKRREEEQEEERAAHARAERVMDSMRESIDRSKSERPAPEAPAPAPPEAPKKRRMGRWALISVFVVGLAVLGMLAIGYLGERGQDSASDRAKGTSSSRQSRSAATCTTSRQCIVAMLGKGRARDFEGLQAVVRRFDELEKPPIGNRNTARQLNAAGLELFRAGKYDEAVWKFSQGLRENPRDAEVVMNLAFANAKVGAKQETLVGLAEDALTIQSNYVPAWVFIAEILARRNAQDEAAGAIWIATKYSSSPERALEFFQARLGVVREPELGTLYREAISIAERELAGGQSNPSSQSRLR